MGTREVYEEKLRRGNLHHDPTINPGLGSARCPRCLSLINPNSANGEWTITSVLRDASAVAGSGLGGLLTAVHGFNTGIPFLQNRVRGPKWLPFVVGLPPLFLLSGVGAAFGGYALPKFAQLTVTSYYASSSASSYGISLLTRQILLSCLLSRPKVMPYERSVLEQATTCKFLLDKLRSKDSKGQRKLGICPKASIQSSRLLSDTWEEPITSELLKMKILGKEVYRKRRGLLHKVGSHESRCVGLKINGADQTSAVSLETSQ